MNVQVNSGVCTLLLILGVVFAYSAEAGQTKVDVCHVPPDSPEDAHFISVGLPSARAHAERHADEILSDGDYTCSVGVGECVAEGYRICTSDGIACDVEPALPPEVTEQSCDDGLDNDCDGLTDDADSDCQVIASPCDSGTAGIIAGDPWVVCRADADSAWLSANVWGTYNAHLACQSLGYSGATQFGGNCGSVCGYCDFGVSSCSNPGQEYYDGAGGYSPELLEYTVHWRCE